MCCDCQLWRNVLLLIFIYSSTKFWSITFIRHCSKMYDTMRSYFNVQSKADISHLNLPKTKKVEKKKSKNGYAQKYR